MSADVAPARPVAEPLAYFLTFTCYGNRLHGDARGSVDREHNAPRGRYAPEDPGRVAYQRGLMREAEVSLSSAEREIVLGEILRSCQFEGWLLHAAHVRSTHVHLIVAAKASPEKITHELKSYSTRALNQRFGRKAKRWAAHGSMAWLWDAERLDRAMDYVVRQQGKPMALYVNLREWPEYAD